MKKLSIYGNMIMIVLILLSVVPVQAAPNSPLAQGETPPELPVEAGLATLSSGASSVVTGGFFSCALLTGGGVKCWGYNNKGQLGNGTNTDSSVLVDVLVEAGGAALTGVTAITAGGGFTCALMTGGTVKCWGDNQFGQLGNGTTTESNVPVDVLVSVGGAALTGVTAVSAGRDHTCALMSGGGVKCWGNNSKGQLGYGANGDGTESSVPVIVLESIDIVAVPLSGMSSISSGGGYFTCGVTTSGGVKCWGSNNKGQLGNASTTDSNLPVDVLVASGGAELGGISAVFSGISHVCALTTGGGVKCWGENNYGQLGNNLSGAGVYSDVPVNVLNAGGTANLSGVSIINSGAGYTCALISGGVQCWGFNSYGELGSGSSDALSSLPVNVVVAAGGAALSGVSSLSLSPGYHTCAVMSTGGVKCWGMNFYGELGNGAGGLGVFSNVPVNVNGLTSYAINGRVTLNGNALSGVTISAGAGRTTTSDSSGNYSLTGLSAGTFTLTPSKSGYVFTPALLGVIITSADVSGKNFTAKVGFNSQFNGNMLGWGAVRGVWTVNTINLLSPILSVTGSASTAYRAANYSNLDYSVRLMRTGCTTCFTSLFIRGSGVTLATGGWSSGYQFSITRDGRYYVAKTVASRLIVLKPLTLSTSILKLNSWNVLRVVASGSSLRFYANNKLLWSGTDVSLASGKVGVGLVNNGTGGANRLSVDYATLSVP